MSVITEQIYDEINALISKALETHSNFDRIKTTEQWKTSLTGILDNFKQEIQGEKKKRNRSAYAIFCAENRDKVKEKFDLTKPREIITKLGEIWASMKEDKTEHFQRYEQMAKEEKQQNKAEERGRSRSRSRSSSPRASSKPREKSPRRTSAYFIFSTYARRKYAEELKGMKLGDVSQFISEKWADVKNNEKELEKFTNLAKQYDEQKAAEQGESVPEKKDDKKKPSDKKETEKKDKKDDKKKPSDKKETEKKEEKKDKKDDKKKPSDKKDSDKGKSASKKVDDEEEEEEEIAPKRLLKPDDRKRETISNLLNELRAKK